MLYDCYPQCAEYISTLRKEVHFHCPDVNPTASFLADIQDLVNMSKLKAKRKRDEDPDSDEAHAVEQARREALVALNTYFNEAKGVEGDDAALNAPGAKLAAALSRLASLVGANDSSDADDESIRDACGLLRGVQELSLSLAASMKEAVSAAEAARDDAQMAEAGAVAARDQAQDAAAASKGCAAEASSSAAGAHFASAGGAMSAQAAQTTADQVVDQLMDFQDAQAEHEQAVEQRQAVEGRSKTDSHRSAIRSGPTPSSVPFTRLSRTTGGSSSSAASARAFAGKRSRSESTGPSASDRGQTWMNR